MSIMISFKSGLTKYTSFQDSLAFLQLWRSKTGDRVWPAILWPLLCVLTDKAIGKKNRQKHETISNARSHLHWHGSSQRLSVLPCHLKTPTLSRPPRTLKSHKIYMYIYSTYLRIYFGFYNKPTVYKSSFLKTFKRKIDWSCLWLSHRLLLEGPARPQASLLW